MTAGLSEVGLVMIVRNEALILPRLADSVRDHIDYYTIVDTGSTDNTIEVVRDVFDGVPGDVFLVEWEGFGPSRNVALGAAKSHTDWMLVMDADETFHGSIPVPGDTDCIEAEQYNGDLRFWLPRVLRSGANWRSHCRVHEYYASPTARPPTRTKSFHIEHHGDGHDRPQKFERDMPLLMQDWWDEPNGRTAFYIARTYEDTGMPHQAITWYRTRLEMPGWAEETFYARYRLGKCLLDVGAFDEGCGALWASWGLSPERAEPLVALAEYYRCNNQWLLAWKAADLAFSYCGAQPGNKPPPPPTGLFVDISATNWRIAYEQSISSWYIDNKQRGRQLERYLLERDDIPEPYHSSVIFNGAFYD